MFFIFAYTLILVITSGLAHALWNMLAKQSTDKHIFLWLIYAPVTNILLPILIIELSQAHLGGREWFVISLSFMLQGAYALLLAHTYKLGDLSQVYPIMRGIPTLLVPMSGVLFLNETLPFQGWIGIACMIVGFILISRPEKRQLSLPSLKEAGPVVLALCVGLCVTFYTLADKINLQYLSPLSLLNITCIGFMLGLTPSVIKSGRIKHVIRTQGNKIWLGAILSPGSYFLFLLAAQQQAISIISPMREVGIVFSTILGIIVLKESQGFRRIATSLIILTGIILIATSNQY